MLCSEKTVLVMNGCYSFAFFSRLTWNTGSCIYQTTAPYSLFCINFSYSVMSPGLKVSFAYIPTIPFVPGNSCFYGKSPVFPLLTEIFGVLVLVSKRQLFVS